MSRLQFKEQVQKDLFDGINALANAVKVTLGPKGRNVLIDKPYEPHVTKDGVKVAESIELSNRFQNMGAQMVKEVASKTNDISGDGTTTATVFAQSIYRNGYKMLAAGHSPSALRLGIEKAVQFVVSELKKEAKSVKGTDEIRQVASISSNNDDTIGEIIAQAMEKVTKDGVITIEEAKGMETEVEVVEGMQFDRGYLSPYFVTDQERQECILDNPYILMFDKKISNMKALISILEQVMQQSRPLLIIAEDVDGEALATLVLNKLSGNLRVCAVKAPGFGDRRRAILEDLAILTGGQLISEEIGLKLENIGLEDLGTAEKVKVTKENTVLSGGKSDEKRLKDRLAELKRQLEASDSDYDKEKIQERIAKLTGGVAVIRIGAATEVELKEKKDRFEDALNATRAAVEEGIIPGGGVAALRISRRLDTLELDEEERFGMQIIRRALEEPVRTIVENGGHESSVVIDKILQKSDFSWGFNARTETYEDLLKSGVIDPVKVTRNALQNAASIASLLLSTDVLICKKEEENSAPAAGGMGGMGGMGMPGMDMM